MNRQRTACEPVQHLPVSHFHADDGDAERIRHLVDCGNHSGERTHGHSAYRAWGDPRVCDPLIEMDRALLSYYEIGDSGTRPRRAAAAWLCAGFAFWGAGLVALSSCVALLAGDAPCSGASAIGERCNLARASPAPAQP